MNKSQKSQTCRERTGSGAVHNYAMERFTTDDDVLSPPSPSSLRQHRTCLMLDKFIT
jgi:hypothetical protein